MPRLLALVCAAVAVALWPRRGWIRPPRRRHRPPHWLRPAVTVTGLAGALVVLGVPWWIGIVVAAAGACVARVRARKGSTPPEDLAAAAGMLDMVAAALASGLAPQRAITAVLDAMRAAAGEADIVTPSDRPPAETVLGEVAALLAVGADPRSAWAPAAHNRSLSDLAAAAGRSALGGTRLAEAARATATDLRRRHLARRRQRAARVGVFLAAPLTLCFLPAFVCLGLAPVMVSLVGSLGLW